MELSLSSTVAYLILASLVTLSPLFTLVAYVRPQLRDLPITDSHRAAILYLASRCVGFTLLGVVAFWGPCAWYLVVVAGAAALTQLLDALIHHRYGARGLVALSLSFAVVLVGCATWFVFSL